ncbi:hypothetical protein C2W62_31115 [Candidatus Entotheonella serta]|nr:hypothetical protein C2W62_31115 [Candidatus Entotheonella serta]
MIASPFIPVKPGVSYTLSVFIRTDVKPFLGVSLFGGLKKRNGQKRNIKGSRITNSQVGLWEESTIFFTPRAHETTFQVKLLFRPDQPRAGGQVWIDHAYLGVKESFSRPPSPKVAFQSDRVRIDELGNYSRRVYGKWELFFPFCMFTDNRRNDWTLYAQQGFNCNIWTASVAAAKRTIDAGMLPAFSLAPYINPHGWGYRNYRELEKNLKAIKASPYYDNLLFVYWDNENSWTEWQPAVESVKRVRNIMPEMPIYVLQGNHGAARAYHNRDYRMSDAVGAYLSGNSGGAAGSGAGLVLLDHTENQVNPVFFAQFNLGTGKAMRPGVWAAIGKGAKGMGFWRDLFGKNVGGNIDMDTQPVQKRPWWDEFPKLVQEVNALLPVIHQQHWASWTVESTVKTLDIGVREYEGESYLFVANTHPQAVDTQITVRQYSKEIGDIQDAISGKVLTTASAGNTFKLRVPGHDVKLLKFDGSVKKAESIPARPLDLRVIR